MIEIDFYWHPISFSVNPVSLTYNHSNPYKTAGPFFTLLGAMLVTRGKPNAYQWIGFYHNILSVIIFLKLVKRKVLF